MLHLSLDNITDVFQWDAIPQGPLRWECLRVGLENFLQILPQLISSRFPVVIDAVMDFPEWYERLRVILASRQVHWVAVRCPLAITEAREQARSDRVIGLAKRQFDGVHAGKTYDLEVDTSVESPENCAARILAHLRRASSAP